MRESDFYTINKAIPGALNNGQVIVKSRVGDDRLEYLYGRHDVLSVNIGGLGQRDTNITAPNSSHQHVILGNSENI